MGSAGRGKKLPDVLLQKARETGKEVAKNGCILVTGACMGTPYEAAIGAGEEKGLVVGFSPASNLTEHLNSPICYPQIPEAGILIYTGMGKEGRNLMAIKNCDAVIFAAGSAGTLTEFALAYHMGKVIGLLEGTGGITEKIPEIISNIQKDTGAILTSDDKPKQLVKKIIGILRQMEKLN